MGLKVIAYGAWGSGKTAFAASAAEVGPMGVVDNEQRWQHYTIPHPTEKARKYLHEGTEIPAYAYPRLLRQDVAWLPRTEHTIWLVQTMEPGLAWACVQAWAKDPSIKTQVLDSASVLWDLLSDGAYEAQAENEKLGGLAWVPVKKTFRRITFAMMASGQNWIQIAHRQEILDKAMRVQDVRPWTEKKSPHWADIIAQFVLGEKGLPRMRVEKEKVLGGAGGTALKSGTILEAPTFKQVLVLAGEREALPTGSPNMEEIERRASATVAAVAGTPTRKEEKD